MSRTVRAAALTALAVLTVGGCGAPTGHTAPSVARSTATATPVAAPDPAALLRKAGVSEVGNVGTDVYGDLNADGQASEGEQFTAYTNASAATLQQNMAPLTKSPGSQAVITGPRWVVTVTGTGAANGIGTDYAIKPKTIAQRLDGKLIWPGQ